VINLSTLSPDEAAKMFTDGLGTPSLAEDRTALTTLVERLAYLPLAIVQASAYINETQRPVQSYLKLLNEPEVSVIKLLSKDFGDLSWYKDAINPVATTWLISFEHIRKYHRLAIELLSFMACFYEKGIPRSLVWESSSETDEVDIMDAVAVLTGYAFVIQQSDNGSILDIEESYDMHRLVQLAVRNWLGMEGTLRDWMKACTIRLARLFPNRNYEHKTTWTKYLPHAQRISKGNDGEDIPEQYQLLEKMGLCFIVDGKYDEAVAAHRIVVDWRKKKMGIGDRSTLRAYSNLGEALTWKGEWSFAEKYLLQAFNKQNELLGLEHPDTLTSMANLASTFGKQGRWKEAEELEVQVMETRKRVLGQEHPHTLTSIANLASTYRNQGRWKEAEELFVQVMETIKKVLGQEHPYTLTSMANLASTFGNQGRWKEAEELDVQQRGKENSRMPGAWVD
jgi:tetratricopeptide (TPR) repeat protein